MNTKPATLLEYSEVGPEFFARFNYVRSNLPDDTSVEDCLKIMESLTGLVMIKREDEEETSAIGFNK